MKPKSKIKCFRFQVLLLILLNIFYILLKLVIRHGFGSGHLNYLTVSFRDNYGIKINNIIINVLDCNMSDITL